jgi:hypothetical protein
MEVRNFGCAIRPSDVGMCRCHGTRLNDGIPFRRANLGLSSVTFQATNTTTTHGTTLDLTFGFNCLVQSTKVIRHSPILKKQNSQFGKDPKEEGIKTHIPFCRSRDSTTILRQKLKTPEVSRFISSFGELLQTKLWNI